MFLVYWFDLFYMCIIYYKNMFISVDTLNIPYMCIHVCMLIIFSIYVYICYVHCHLYYSPFHFLILSNINISKQTNCYPSHSIINWPGLNICSTNCIVSTSKGTPNLYFSLEVLTISTG